MADDQMTEPEQDLPAFKEAVEDIAADGRARFGGRLVTCAFCDRDTRIDYESNILPAEWEAAWRLIVLAIVFPDLTPAHPPCPGCLVLTLAELAASGRVVIMPIEAPTS
jgi:hypothetical protein